MRRASITSFPRERTAVMTPNQPKPVQKPRRQASVTKRIIPHNERTRRAPLDSVSIQRWFLMAVW
jgi:hypothetical protein